MTRARFLPLVADLACVLAFAFGGKSSHEARDSDWIVFVIAWPFALAVLVAHLVLRRRDTTPASVWPGGGIVVGVTFVLGMILRVISGRGIAFGFLAVAMVFLAVTMLGWRLGVRRIGRRNGPEPA